MTRPHPTTHHVHATPKHVEFHASSTHESIELLAERLAPVLRRVRMADSDYRRFTQALIEAITNAAEHGNESDPGKRITVTCDCLPSEVKVVVEDEGRGFDPDGVPDPTLPENVMCERGRGLLLMRHGADECRIENQGRRIVLIKHFA